MPAKPYREMVLNRPGWDWVTCTSWHIDSFENWIQNEDAATKNVRRLNYVGMQEGKVFVGDGQQNGFFHRMLQVSGGEADVAVPALLWLHDIECTHLDLQITCEWTDSDIFAIAERLRDSFLVDYRTSGEGDTVYIYSRLSDKFIRIYQKSRDVARFEVSYKKPYARAIWKVLQRPSVINDPDMMLLTMKEWLMWELWKLHDDTLMAVFGDALGNNPVKPPKYVPSPENNTERWLRKIVAPALRKYAGSHDRDDYLLAHLMNIIAGEIE